MAEEIIFKTSVDTGTTAKDLQAIDKELGNIDKTTKSTSNDLNKTFDDLNARVESGTLTMRESTQAIKQYQTIALQAGRESPIGKEALQRAGELKDKLGDLKTEITNLGTDGANMKAALQLGSTITAGYGALTGAQALLGKESENLTKTLVKLQAVQAILAAIEEVRSALEKESFLMQKAKTLQTTLLTTATAAYTTVVGTSTGALKIFKLALASTGIGAIIVGIGALVANFEKLTGVLGGVSSSQKILNDTFDSYKKGATSAIEKTNEVKVSFELARQGVISKQEALAKYNQELGGTFGQAKNLNEAEKLFVEKTEAYIKASALRAQADAILKMAAEERVKQMLADQEAQKLANKAASDDPYSIVNIAKKNGEAMAKQSKQRADEFETLSADLLKEASLIESQYQIKAEADTNLKKTVVKNSQDKKQKEIDDAYEKNQAELDAYKRRLEDERALAEADAIWTAEQEAIYAQEKQRIADQEQELQWSIEASKALQWKNDLDNEKRLEEEKVKLHKESHDRKLAIAQDYAGAVNNLAGGIFALSNSYGKQDEKSKEERAKRQFKVQKALNLGMAIIDGYKAITASLSQSPIAIGPIPNPAGIASLAFATATSIANVAKIASAKYEGGSMSGGGGAGVAPPSTVPNTPNPQLANADTTLTSGLSGNTNNQGGGKVFVVDSEITAKQNQTAQALNIATVG